MLPNAMKNLVLVGFMGSGKTSAGRLVAPRLGLRFVDMDEVIEQRQGRTIAQIFADQGEPFFRQLERDLVRELAAQQGLCIATGGGVVLDPDNCRDLAQTGIVICCWVDADTAYQRTRTSRHRPLLETDADRRAHLAALLARRAPLYRAIPLQVDTTHLSVEQLADALERLYRQRS
jgi:shikimate kinase